MRVPEPLPRRSTCSGSFAVSKAAEEKEARGAFLIVASHGGGLAATEVQVGFDLRLRGVDPARVFGKSDRLLG